MSLLRWFFTNKCPNCSSRIASKANFCSACGWGNQTSWRNCTSCGSSVGAESNFCWHCKADLRTQPRDQIVSDCWRREPGVFAVRVPIETPAERLRNGIQVDAGTRGIFLRNGKIALDANGSAIEIGPGYHSLTSFLQRLLGSGPSGNIEALIVTSTPVEVRIDAGTAFGITTNDKFALEAAILIKLQIDELGAFQSAFMPRGTDLVRDDDLAQPVTARVIEVMRRFASRLSSDALLADPNVRRTVEAELGAELPPMLSDAGLRFHSVVDLRFGGDMFERKRQHQTGRASAQMEAAEKEMQMALDTAARIGELQNDDQLQQTIDRISHERCLTSLERDHLINMRKEFMRRDQLTAAAQTELQLRELRLQQELDERRRRELAEAERKEREAALAKKKDDNDVETLLRLREIQMKTLADVKRINVEAERGHFDNRVFLAERLDRVSDTAKVAVSPREQAEMIVALVRAQQPEPRPIMMPPTVEAAKATPPPGGRVQSLEYIVPRYMNAVGLVLRKDAAGNIERVGTAWIVQGRNVLATNAHVAADVDPAVGGGWVVFPGTNGMSYSVSQVELHPEYLRQRTAPSPNAAVVTHDVALIHVATSLPHVGIPVATRFKLHALRELQPVAYMGYPMRGMQGHGVDIDRPRPIAKRGTISSLTDWEQRDTPGPASAQLIRHDLGITGGSSGSPLLDADGEAVGIVCAMNVERVFNAQKRDYEVIPSAAMLNFAQRMDVLADWKGW